MTNESGIERVFYIYNLSGCSCLQPYFHSLLLYTELCEVLWAPKLCWFPNKAGLCPAGTNWGLFCPRRGQACRERLPALWFWLQLWNLVLGPISGQLPALLVLTEVSMLLIDCWLHIPVRSSMLYSCGYTYHLFLFIWIEIVSPKGVLRSNHAKALSHIHKHIHII